MPPDAPGPQAADRPHGHLGGAPDLVAVHEPTASPDLVPRQVLQRSAPESRPARVRRRLRTGLSAAALHVAFAAAFLVLLTWRPEPRPAEDSAPIEVKLVEAPSAKAAPEAEPPKPEPPKPEPAPLTQLIPQLPPGPAPAPDPHPPAPPSVQPPPAGDASSDADASPPQLVAPPPDPTRAKTQPTKTEQPNDETDEGEAKATHEAKPAEGPKVLATTDPKAAFAVPKPAAATPPPVLAPSPAAKAPSETEKLAAALPMDTTGMPASFRAVLSGNGSAVDAAYKGAVYGRFSHAAEIGERARRMHLKGQVIVAFTIDDGGGLASLAVLQSSGNPAIDELGLEMIRSAAPFPAPPPGAQHSFTPAFAFGE